MPPASPPSPTALPLGPVATAPGTRRLRLPERLLFLLMVLAALCSPLSNHADSPAAPENRFLEANRLYEQGRYPEAAAAYQLLLDQGTRSAPLLFNLGNAAFRSGQIGQAIFNYRLALQLAPRDPDILANLQFARNATSGSGVLPSRTSQILARLTLHEWTTLAVAALWLTAALLITRTLRPALKHTLRPWALLAGATTLLTVLAAFWVGSDPIRNPCAIVVVPDASVRFGPLEESRRRYVVRDGAELAVLGRQGDWVQVANGDRETGWIDAAAVRLFPAAR